MLAREFTPEAWLGVAANYDHGIEPIDLGIPGLTNIERIGAGGNAVVYRARQADLDRNIVVKVLTNVDAETTRRRFDRERRAMGRMSQALGIAPLYGSGFTPAGQPYLLMPFYERGSLQDQLERTGAVEPLRAQEIGVAVCNAVQAAHENGVLHRDLKPANILIRRSGQADVADFGIAHLTDDSLGKSQALTMTPLFTAPEVFDGVESGAASDIYSLGATLFAMLNGRPAYADATGTTPILSLMRRINEDPLPPLPPTIPTELAAVVAKAMSKDPADRQHSAGQMAADLAAADMSIPKPPRTRRSPALIAAVVAVLLAAVGGAAAAAYLVDKSETVTAGGPTPTVVSAATPSAEQTPTAASTEPTPIGQPFDVLAAARAAEQALVRIEAFSCTGVEVATGVALNDGIIVTEGRVLDSPWYIDVIYDRQILRATPVNVDEGQDISFLTVDEADLFEELPGVTVGEGDQVAFVGIDGRPALATLVTDDNDRLVAELVNPTAGNAINPLDAVVTDSGGLAGIAAVGPGLIEIITPDEINSSAIRGLPTYNCPSLQRDLGPNDAESVVSPALGELLTMQQLSDAYATERWAVVRQIEPGKTSLRDEDFVNGWRPLRQGFIYPVQRERDEQGLSRWRIALIGHETWGGTDLTTLFCLTWTVDPVSGAVVQTNEDNVTVFGSQSGAPQRLGFTDPGDLRDLITQACML